MSEQHLTEVVRAYAHGETELDNRQFAKMLKESGIFDKHCTTTDADLIFTKTKAKGARKLDLRTLVIALEQVADKKHMSVDDLVDSLRLPGFLTQNGTGGAPRGPERFFYDPSTFTGTHARGGPTTKGGSQEGYADLSTLSHREHTQDDALHRSAGERSTGAGSDSLSLSRQAAREGSAAGSRRRAAQAPDQAPRRGPERFFYDTKTYTGSHAHGGPTAKGSAAGVDGYADLSALTRRK